jgi:pimeloyl-ACP methyl ester carboxylesterase
MTTEFLDAGDVRIAFERSGSGPPLLLMHGAEASRRMFSALVPLLAPRFSVITYDQRDCGDTESLQRAPQPATLADLAGDACALITGLGHARAHVFGSSFGGRVAQMLAIRHGHVVDRLALGSTWPLPATLAQLDPEGSAALAALRARLPHSAEELAERFFPARFLAERPDLRGVFAGVRPQSERAARRAAAVADAPDVDLSTITASALVIAGELDRVVPPALTLSLGSQLPRCTSLLLADVGHATALQAPQALAAHLVHFFLDEEPLP